MPKALQHECPRWEPDGDDHADYSREIWRGALRSVSPKRARVLRKRGVPLMPLHAVRDVQASTLLGGRRFEPTTPDGRARYAWFEPTEHAEARHGRRRLRCYLVATRPQPFGRKGWLAARLEQQRLGLATQWAIRSLNKALYGRLTMEARLNWGNIDMLRRATPEQLDELQRAKLADFEARRYAKY